MAQRAIREADGKSMLARLMKRYADGRFTVRAQCLSVDPFTDLEKATSRHRWLEKKRLVVKPDQLIKRRGKGGLLLLDAEWNTAKEWIAGNMNRTVTVEGVTGVLKHFIVEPFLPHETRDERYIALTSEREGDRILFFHQGGVDVGDIDARAEKLFVPIGETPPLHEIEKHLLKNLPDSEKTLMAAFITGLFQFYCDLNYAYLEMNPFVVKGRTVIPLDYAAKLDDTAAFINEKEWGNIIFPKPFGREPAREERFIEELDAKTGASLKLSLLNPRGRVWTMVAGGGASVIYADTITDLGYMDEMANYGEYSGNPDEHTTYLYARTILDLMTREKHPDGKILIIGGGIANFTDVAKTFAGIIRALREYASRIRKQNIRIFVRRGGPNYKEGLRRMKVLGSEEGIDIDVYGPETHMTNIVAMALKGGR